MNSENAIRVVSRALEQVNNYYNNISSLATVEGNETFAPICPATGATKKLQWKEDVKEDSAVIIYGVNVSVGPYAVVYNGKTVSKDEKTFKDLNLKDLLKVLLQVKTDIIPEVTFLRYSVFCTIKAPYVALDAAIKYIENEIVEFERCSPDAFAICKKEAEYKETIKSLQAKLDSIGILFNQQK